MCVIIKWICCSGLSDKADNPDPGHEVQQAAGQERPAAEAAAAAVRGPAHRASLLTTSDFMVIIMIMIYGDAKQSLWGFNPLPLKIIASEPCNII